MQAFDEIFRRTNKLLYSFIVKRLPSRQDADEVFQEVYFRIHKYVATYRQEQRAIVWLYTIARHAIIDRLNANRRRDLPEDPDTLIVVSKEESAESRLLFGDLLTSLMEGLSDADKRLFCDRLLSDMDYDEIATAHGISNMNARQKVSRLMRALRAKTTS